MMVTAMKPRHRAFGEAQRGTRSQPGDAHFSSSFNIDARIGHAWFARSGRPKLPVKRGPDMLPALRRAELVLADQGRAIARRARRIPADAIVAMGAPLSPAGPPVGVAGGTPDRGIANDNAVLFSPRARTLLREVLFLLIFGATLAGTYYLGRLHAYHNVIVVPDRMTGTGRIV